MKSIHIKSILFIICFFSVVAIGCLKDKEVGTGIIQPTHGPETKVIEIKLTASTTSNFFVLAVNNSNTDTTVNLVPINLATNSAAPEDLHVTVDLDSNLVTVFDTTGTAAGTPGGNYQVPSSNMYSIVNPVVTIPKGSHTGYLQIKFKPSVFIGGSWALGFKITGIKESGYVISGNLYTGITSILVKNSYDGEYSVNGTFKDVENPGITGSYPFEADLISTGLSSNVMYNLNPSALAGFYHLISSGGSLSVYGGFCPEFTIDPTTGNVTSVTNFYSPTDAANNPHARDAKLDPSGVNKYDFSTKTMKVSYIMYQGDLGIDRTFFNETFTYVGPR